MDDDIDILALYNVGGSFVGKKENATPRQENSPKTKLPRSPKIGFSPVDASPLSLDKRVLSQSVDYRNRSKKGDVISRFNCENSDSWEQGENNDIKARVTLLEPTKGFLEQGSKMAAVKTNELSLLLAELVFTEGEAIVEEKNLPPAQSLKKSSVENTTYVGRIFTNDKLSSTNVGLEGDRTSVGNCVALDISQIEECYLFPGQIIAVNGKNNQGHTVTVESFITPSALPAPKIEMEGSGSLKILVAAGPFTTTNSVHFDPLSDLVEAVNKNKPHVLVLVGPFLPFNHESVCELPVSFQDLFLNQMKSLKETLDSSITVLIVASSEEAHHVSMFPSPRYHFEGLESLESEKFRFLPDPSLVSIQGVVIGITATDILFHLSKSELARTSISKDRMGRLVRHILSQKTFYPLYPPVQDIALDVEKWCNYARLGCSPHMLILPSQLRHFVKDVDGILVMNPEKLTKGIAGGSYAKIHINPKGTQPVSSIVDFTEVELLRI